MTLLWELFSCLWIPQRRLPLGYRRSYRAGHFAANWGVSSVDADPLPQGAGVAMAVPPVAFGTRAHGISLDRVGSSLSF